MTPNPHPTLRVTFIRHISVPHPSGGFAVQIGNPADLSPEGRREKLAALGTNPGQSPLTAPESIGRRAPLHRTALLEAPQQIGHRAPLSMLAVTWDQNQVRSRRLSRGYAALAPLQSPDRASPARRH